MSMTHFVAARPDSDIIQRPLLVNGNVGEDHLSPTQSRCSANKLFMDVLT